MAVNNIERGEICAMYRQAADKRAQIKILSELYLISRKEVAEIVHDAGITDKVIERILSRRDKGNCAHVRAWTDDEEEEAKTLWLGGANYREIAAILGRSVDSVRIRLTSCIW